MKILQGICSLCFLIFANYISFVIYSFCFLLAFNILVLLFLLHSQILVQKRRLAMKVLGGWMILVSVKWIFWQSHRSRCLKPFASLSHCPRREVSSLILLFIQKIMDKQWFLPLTAHTDLPGEVRGARGNRAHRLSYRGRALTRRGAYDREGSTV